MTLTKLLDLYERTKPKNLQAVNDSFIEWAKVLRGDETIDTDGYVPSESYEYEVEFKAVVMELDKFPHIPKRRPIGNGKRNYLVSKERNGTVLLNSGSRKFQIVIKFNEKYIAEQNERVRFEQEKFRNWTKETRKFLMNYTGKIRYTYEYVDQGYNEYESKDEIELCTFERGVITSIETIYHREYSTTSDIYYVVDHGGPGVWEYEIGDSNAEFKYDHSIYEKDCTYHGHRFDTDLFGYWKIVQSWFNEAYKKYQNEKKNKDDTK
jgi:hypothetical protein